MIRQNIFFGMAGLVCGGGDGCSGGGQHNLQPG